MREKLTELLDEALLSVDWEADRYPNTDEVANILIANGVTIPVRCKDCRLWIRNGGFTKSPTGHCFCHDIETTAHDFCSYGERRT